MFRLGVIRYLLAEIKNAEIDHGEQSDQQIQKIVSSQIKKMKDAITDFQRGGREDLIAQEEKRIDILTSYLPAQMSAAELEKIVHQAIEDNPSLQIGPLTGLIMKQVAGQADGGQVSGLIKKLLSA